MKEELLHFVWSTGNFNSLNLATTNGEKIEIIYKGLHNTNAGPDFLNAKVKIGNTLWAGQVEMHVNASAWEQHGHHADKAYDNVVLHVVYEDDKPIMRADGILIPTLVLKGLISPKIINGYEDLISNSHWIPCEKLLPQIDPFITSSWLDRLTAERLEQKTTPIAALLKDTKNDWQEAFYRMLARYFGLKVNAEPFEALAQSLPQIIIAKHKNNLLQIEALLFGQAGLLESTFKDDYPNQLKKEYTFLRHKHNLTPISAAQWKFLRLRPANFPTVRLAQLADLLLRSSGLFSKVIEAENYKQLRDFFNAGVSEYWVTHYRFDTESKKRDKHLGNAAIDLLLINTVIPFIFTYGKMKDLPDLQDRALAYLEEIKPEKNNIITRWEDLDIKAKSAYQTQALLQLKNNYCTPKQCLACGIGNSILKIIA